MRYHRSIILSCLCAVIALGGVSAVVAKEPIDPFPSPRLPNYPTYGPDPNDVPSWATLQNDYIACRVGIGGNLKVFAVNSDGGDGRNDKAGSSSEHDWRVAGRYGVYSLIGDQETVEDDKIPLTYMAQAPCHYFGYWKLKIGNDMRMVGDGATGSWYSTGGGQVQYNPTVYETPPTGLEPTLGKTGPFMRGIWVTQGGNGSTIAVEVRVHLVRDMVRFEYRITNKGTVSETIGFEQNGDVEVGYPGIRSDDDGGRYGPYQNLGYAFVSGKGATPSDMKQTAMMFGGVDPADGKTANPPVPDWFEVYDDVKNPGIVTRNILSLEDATKPDFVAIGEYQDLFHQNLWIPTDYKPDKTHKGICDMCWVLCWNQQPVAPGATRTIVAYYGVAAATSRWTYLSGKKPARDSALLAVQTVPRNIRYDSTLGTPGSVELSPTKFTVKAYVYNLATDPGPYDLRDAEATISLPKGLILDPDTTDNNPTKPFSAVIPINSESEPVQWSVCATGDYAGELPIFVSVVDKDPSGKHWQQTVTRKVFVPATKRSQFQYGWQLMNVPFAFNNPIISHVLKLPTYQFSAKYWDAERKVYTPVQQVTPGQPYWIYVDGPTWGHPLPFTLASDAGIAGEALGTGQQVLEQRISLSKGWNMFANPFVYPVYWGQVLVYSGDESKPLDDAYRTGWIDKTLFSWNTDKQDYDISSDVMTLLNPWKGYWVNCNKPLTLLIRPPLYPAGDVTAHPGGK